MRLACLLGCALLFSCGTNDDDDSSAMDSGQMDAAAMDSTTTMDAGMESLAEIGTGIDRFEVLTEGQAVMIVQGPQGGGRMGGFHVWHGVSVHDMDPSGVTLNFRTYLVSSGEEIASQERMADLIPGNGNTWVAFGIAPPFTDCCLAANHDIRMTVMVTDSTGKTASDERVVRPGNCVDFTGINLCP